MAKKTWWRIIIIVAIIATGLSVWLNRYNINDWYVLRAYQAPPEIAELADESKMSDYGRRLFYVGHPKITSGEEFNEKCRDYEETKVLGCIVSGRDVGLSIFSGGGYEIYILNVTEEELDGIQEVTAAHEMLHAAYERLSPTQRQEIDAEIARVYNNINNEKLKEVVGSYAAKDASVLGNELHSLLGTEVNNVGPVLEKHYSQYFTDRSKVVAMFEEYEAVFDRAKNEAETLYGSIKLLERQILAERESLDQAARQLERRKEELESYRSSGQLAIYNQQVPQYNQLVNEYNALVAEIKELFDSYNQLIAQYDDLVVKQKQLVDAIDSNVMPEDKL